MNNLQIINEIYMKLQEESKWWDSLNYTQQQIYLRMHPKSRLSKFKNNINKSHENTIYYDKYKNFLNNMQNNALKNKLETIYSIYEYTINSKLLIDPDNRKLDQIHKYLIRNLKKCGMKDDVIKQLNILHHGMINFARMNKKR